MGLRWFVWFLKFFFLNVGEGFGNTHAHTDRHFRDWPGASVFFFGVSYLCHAAMNRWNCTLCRGGIRKTKTLGPCCASDILYRLKALLRPLVTVYAGEDPVDRKSQSGVSCTKHGSKTMAFGSASSQTLSIDSWDDQRWGWTWLPGFSWKLSWKNARKL